MKQRKIAGIIDQSQGKVSEEQVLSMAVGHEYHLHSSEVSR
jgi:hypothetical protein